MSNVLKIIFIIIISIIQLSFISAFNGLAHLDIILSIAIILLFFHSKTSQHSGKGLNFLSSFVVISGVILDSYSQLPFPVITLSLITSIFLLNILFKNLFTNRSLYSLMLLGLIGTIIYNFVLYVLVYLAYIFKFAKYYPELNKLYFSFALWQIIANIIFLAILWFIFNFFRAKIQKTFFLE